MKFTILLFALWQLNLLCGAEDSVLERSSKKYIGKNKPSSNKEVTSFKFVSSFGESITRSSKSKSIEKKSDDEFNSIEKSLTYIRSKKDKSSATFIGNSGSDEVHVFEGSDSISFMEHVGAGYFQQMVVSDFWDKEKGGFIATYTRIFSFGFGDRFSISTTVYHGIAIPWD
jgi:hypothetical protein